MPSVALANKSASVNGGSPFLGLAFPRSAPTIASTASSLAPGVGGISAIILLNRFFLSPYATVLSNQLAAGLVAASSIYLAGLVC